MPFVAIAAVLLTFDYPTIITHTNSFNDLRSDFVVECGFSVPVSSQRSALSLFQLSWAAVRPRNLLNLYNWTKKLTKKLCTCFLLFISQSPKLPDMHLHDKYPGCCIHTTLTMCFTNFLSCCSFTVCFLHFSFLETFFGECTLFCLNLTSLQDPQPIFAINTDTVLTRLLHSTRDHLHTPVTHHTQHWIQMAQHEIIVRWVQGNLETQAVASRVQSSKAQLDATQE
jgi:hypothetical protein